MRVSRAQASANRRKILDEAARMFREGGIAGIGVDAVMNAAGLTHGGFYAHFESKNKLAAEACRQSVAGSIEKWTKLAESERPLEAIVEHYLSTKHRDNPGDGCLIAALATEASRGSPEVRRAITEGIESLLGVLESKASGRGKESKRANALSMFASMVGAIVMARAVDDPILSNEILAAAAKSLLPEE